MIDLEFIDSISGATIDEFRGTCPRKGDEIVFGGPNYDEGTERSYVVLNIRRYCYGAKNDRYEFVQVLVARCE